MFRSEAPTAGLGGDAALAATLLRKGALFLVRQAHSPPNRGTNDLLAAARGLDSLAAAMRSVIANRHAIVRDLSTKPGPDLRALDDPLASLHIEIQAMHRRLERTPKGAP